MLVLLRKVGEEIVIKDEISVRVVRVSRNRAFLAIEAPAKVSVDREEVWQAKKRERLAAGRCASAKKTAGPEETRQSKAGCESGNEPASMVTSFVRRANPMLNRVAGKDRAEEDPSARSLPSSASCRCISGGPLSTSSLSAAIRHLIAASQACDGPDIEFCDDLTIGELRPEMQPAVLSIVTELLLNACRHSKSKNVLLGLAQDDGCLFVQVQDWGIGFDFDLKNTRPQNRGLKGIQDLVAWLGGTLAIDSQRGKGTCAIVEIPLSREAAPNGQATVPKPR